MKKFLISTLTFFLICTLSIVIVIFKIQPTASDEEIRAMIKETQTESLKENKSEFILIDKENDCEHSVLKTYKLSEPNCTTNGIDIKICQECGFKTEEKTDKISHNFTSKTIEATCIKEGISYSFCSVCGLENNSKILEKTLHKLQDVVISKSTCTTNGVTKTICQNCKTEFNTKYTDKIKHSWKENKNQLPTPIKDGFIEYKCSSCGLLKQESVSFQKVGENNLYIPSLSFNKKVTLANCNQSNTDKYDICCDIGVIDEKNPLFFGHNTGSFSKLDQVKIGDLIYFTIGDKTTVYKVTVSEPAIVVNNGYNIKGLLTGEMCLSQKDTETLHFFTCYNVLFKQGNRWIVVAEKVN